MSEQERLETINEEKVSRRGLIARGGVLAVGASVLGGPAAATAFAGAAATKVKVGVVTHGDTGSFWSVFKKGVDQAASDLKVARRQRNTGLREQRRVEAGGRAERRDRRQGECDRDLRARRERTQGSARRGPPRKGIEIITVNSGLGAFDALKTYMVHVGQTEDVAGQGAGKQFTAAGAKNLVVIIHEASNSGLTQRAAGAKKTFKGTTKTLVIPHATSDLPGTQQKIAAYFKANPKTDALLGLNPDIATTALNAVSGSTKVGTFDLSPGVISADPVREDPVRDRPAAVPPGVPAGRLRVPVRDQPEHRRQRPAGSHGAGHRQQGQRRQGGRAREGGHPLSRAHGVGGAALAHPCSLGGTASQETQ